MNDLVVFLISVGVAFSVSGSCSLMESVLLSLTPGQIAELSIKHPKIGKYWTDFKKNIDNPISFILILNTTAHTIGASVAGAAFDHIFNGHYLWLFSIGFTFIMLQYTEIFPKTFGVRFNSRMAVLIARPLYFGIILFLPMIKLCRFLNRPFEGKEDSHISTVDELRYIASVARQKHQLGSVQEEIIQGAASLTAKTAADIMLPLSDVVMMSSKMSLREAIETAHLDAHTRFPVCEEDDRERIIGYVNFKEIIAHQQLNPQATSFEGIIRPILRINEDSTAATLLKTFTNQHVHLAMICDQGGKCLGLVTLEDIVEELVGELEDEFDRLPSHFHLLKDEKVLLIGGGCLMYDVRTKIAYCLLGRPREETANYSMVGDEAKTLAQWLHERLGHPPVRGDSFSYRGVEFTVRRVRRGKVFDVQIQRNTPSDGSENG